MNNKHTNNINVTQTHEKKNRNSTKTINKITKK